jgi:hypothetical protein
MVAPNDIPDSHEDLRHIFRTAIGVVIGVIGVGAIAYALWEIAHNHFGFFSYQGLSKMQVAKVAHELDMRYKILSRVVGSNGPGHRFYRGIYTSKDGGFPLYYRFEYFPGGDAKLDLYPMIFESWSTEGEKQATMTFPATGERALSQSRYEKKQMLNS